MLKHIINYLLNENEKNVEEVDKVMDIEKMLKNYDKRDNKDMVICLVFVGIEKIKDI